MAVALVALGAGVLGLRVHDLVDERLGERPGNVQSLAHFDSSTVWISKDTALAFGMI